MAKTRSPQYPAISLKEAVDKVSAVYAQDYQNTLPRKVVAEHMGYQSLNGKSLGVLAALGKFGLLEGRGDNTRVTDLGVQIIAHPSGTPERGAALREAAGKPDLFAELDAKFQSGKASDQALRSYLLTQKFIPSAADAAIRAYRETKTFVNAESMGYTPPISEQERIEMEPSAGKLALQGHMPHVSVQAPVLPGVWPPPQSTSPFQVTMMTDRVIVSGTLMSRASIEAAIRALEMAKNFLPDTVQPAPPSGEAG